MKKYLLIFILITYGFVLKSQSRKDSIYQENRISKTQIKSNNQLYDIYTSLKSNQFSIQKSNFKIPIMTSDEEQLAIKGMNGLNKINKQQIINILSIYAKKNVKRNGFKDYYMTLNFFIDKNTYEIKHIRFYLPKTFLKDVKQINQLETELINKTKFTFVYAPVPNDFKPPFIIFNVFLNEKDFISKF